MNGEIVNLRRVRKAKARSEKQAEADQNRARFGRTRAERELQTARANLERRQLEALRRDKDEGR